MLTENGEFANRRKKLLAAIEKDSAAILFASAECIRNGDVHYPFRQQSDFYYFTAFNEPDAVALFLPDHTEGQFILFNRPRDPLMERWLGPMVGQEGACEQWGADSAFDINLLDEKIIELLHDRRNIYYELGKNKAWDQKMMGWLSTLANNRKNLPCPFQLADIRKISSEMRLIKSANEIELMKKAAILSAQAHCKAIEKCRPGLFEFELEAVLNYELMVQGCRFSAYPAIVGGGGNACVLHYVDNKDELKEGDLVLVDAGGEYANYAADITRTFPVNGKFSTDQALLYEIVLAAQRAVIDAIKPGIFWHTLQEIAVEFLTKGLVSLGIIPGPLEEAIKNKTYQDYYMHNIGHWLGLDVHDVGAYKVNGEWRKLEAGMVLTVEPGLYLSAHEQLDQRWWNIGIRIEDDVLVTPTGCEVLSCAVPKEIKELEKMMARS
jgi:Xaa-Pro aminopeptidase